MKRLIVASVFMVLLFICNASAGTPGEYLNGKWLSPAMVAEFDVEGGTYIVTAMGKTTTQKLEIVSDDGKTIIFKSDGKTIIAKKNSDGSITMAKEGGIPVMLKRAP